MAARLTKRFIQQIEAGQGNPSYLKVVAMTRNLGEGAEARLRNVLAKVLADG
jgi:predicted transcriptional regulator